MKARHLILAILLLSFLTAGQNMAQAYEDTYSINWTLTANNTSRLIIKCNNNPVFDVTVNRQSSEPAYSYTFFGNESLTDSNCPYDVKMKGTLYYHQFGNATAACHDNFEISVTSSTVKINEMYVRFTDRFTEDNKFIEMEMRCRAKQNTATFTIPPESAYTWKINSFRVVYSPVVTLADFQKLPDGSYEIATKEDWTKLSFLVNGNENSCSGVTFRQTAPISFGDTENERIGLDSDHPFLGTYDGGGKAISGIYYNDNDYDYENYLFDYETYFVGLFGYIGEGGTVQNVDLRSCVFVGSEYVGGIVGVNHGGTVRNCSVTDVNIDGGWGQAGGIVGKNESGGTVIGCLSNVSLTANSGHTPKKQYGGIAGFNGGTIQDCLFTGSVSIVTEQYGSIAGVNENGILTNNYYYNNTIGGVDGSDTDGARRAREIKGQNFAIDGSRTTYDVSGLTAIGTSALSYSNTNQTRIYSGEGQTMNLSYTGQLQEGEVPAFKVNNVFIAGNTFTMPASDVDISGLFVSTPPISVTGHFSNGVYWSTFCHGILRYALPEGATAYTMDAEHHLYRLGDDGRTIPGDVAVVILADRENITLTYDSGTSDIAIHGDENILRGSYRAVSVDDITGTPHVLGVVNNVFGFHPFVPTGTDRSIPAHRAYYVVQD